VADKVFTLEARPRFLPDIWRLQKDDSWRMIKDITIKDDKKDWTTSNTSVIYKFIEECESVNLGPKIYPLEPSEGIVSPTDDHVYLTPTLHRTSKPHKPTLTEMRNLIRQGDDQINNMLIIDLNGYFSLLEFSTEHVNSFVIAVRHGAFIAGNGYIGPQAADDETFTNRVFHTMLYGWLEHLQTGQVNWFMDIPSQESLDDLHKKIDSLNFPFS